MDQQIFNLTIGGQAGQGIKGAGLVCAKIATRSGKHVYTYSGYPSLIRGGHNFMQISISNMEITAPTRKNDLWIALDQKSIDLHIDEYTPGCGIVYDGSKNYDLSKIKPEILLYPIPFSKLAKDAGGGEILSNTVALGAVVFLLGGNLEIFKDLLKEEFTHKGEEVVALNQNAAKLGFEYAEQNFQDKQKNILHQEENITPKIVANGNDAVVLGAIAAGLQFAAVYPMSPISNILYLLAQNQEKYGYIYKQPEDEISAVNMAIGASLAGARAMTATSGGGFCLMTEGLGLAGITETPIVIIDGMRPGPATGLPTWSAQGDLQFVLHASQGDFPKIVIAAGDAEETFYMTMKAFNLTDKYQTPVILLIDKNICENDQSLPVFDTSGYNIDRGKLNTDHQEGYARFAPSDDGISTRTIPGSGNFFIANSYEHTAEGFDSEEIIDINTQMQKRMAKLLTCARDEDIQPKLYGPENADVTIVSWGSNKGAILHAMKNYTNVNFLHITWMNPFPTEQVKNILGRAHYIINIECNFSGALKSLIREKTGIDIYDNLLKYDGRPIFPEEIIEKINNALSEKAKF